MKVFDGSLGHEAEVHDGGDTPVFVADMRAVVVL
jgi:hypothetical protein